MEQERVKETQQRGDKDAGVIDDILYAAFVWLNLIVLGSYSGSIYQLRINWLYYQQFLYEHLQMLPIVKYHH